MFRAALGYMRPYLDNNKKKNASFPLLVHPRSLLLYVITVFLTFFTYISLPFSLCISLYEGQFVIRS